MLHHTVVASHTLLTTIAVVGALFKLEFSLGLLSYLGSSQPAFFLSCKAVPSMFPLPACCCKEMGGAF